MSHNGYSDWQKCCLAYQGDPKSCATPCNHCARMAKVLVEEREFIKTSRPIQSATDIHLRELIAAAKGVTWFDWSGNDLDALQAIQRLHDAIARFELEAPNRKTRITAAQQEKKFMAAIRKL